MRAFLLTTALVFTAPTAFAQTLFLDDAQVVNANGKKTQTDVILTDGIISRRGESLIAPSGSTTLTGAWVTPGLFAPMSSLGLTDLGSAGAGNDIASEHSTTNAAERVADSFNPKSIHIGNVRQSGITHALVAPRSGSNSIFAGTGAIISMTGEFDSVLIPDAFVMVDLGETGTVRAGGSRAAAMAQLRAAINDADAFFKRYSNDPAGGDILSRQDALAFSRATRGEIPLVIRANRASDMMNLIKLKETASSLNMIIVGAAEAWQIAGALADAKVRIIMDPLENLPSSFEATGARLDNVMFLEKAGVDYAIANLSALGVTKPATLAQHAGNAVVEGISWDAAFAAISSLPASWFGIEEKTTVVWDGDPLEITSAPIAMSINGEAQSMTSRQKALRDRYNPLNTISKPHKYR